jgi:hypothetical protein
MIARALIDNDVIIKVAAYGFGATVTGIATVSGSPPAMLSVGRFVVRDRLARAQRFSDGGAALRRFESVLAQMSLLDPTDEEIAAAADFEAAASRLNLELDSGESQLLAVLVNRAADVLITGDKRAIEAIALVATDAVQGRLASFEQLMCSIVGQVGAEAVRKAVCGEPLADKTMTICCSCASASAPTAAEMLAAIESYINHLRKRAAGTLFAQNNLSALAA